MIIKAPKHDYWQKDSFSSGGVYNGWVTCRDDVLRFTGSGIFYFHSSKILSNITKFLQRIEDIIKLKKEDRLKFVECDDPEVFCIELGSFWNAKPRRSLLTLLIRAGKSYDEKIDNWKERIEKSKYCKSLKSRAAVFRFLEGHTELKVGSYDFHGWCNFFGYAKKPIEELLV
jgi:hypothetical protein